MAHLLEARLEVRVEGADPIGGELLAVHEEPEVEVVVAVDQLAVPPQPLEHKQSLGKRPGNHKQSVVDLDQASAGVASTYLRWTYEEGSVVEERSGLARHLLHDEQHLLGQGDPLGAEVKARGE